MKKSSVIRRKLTATAVLIAVAFGILYGIFFNETTGFTIPCVFHAVTGLYCASCGTTRACFDFLHGEFYASFRMNELAWVLLPALGLWIIIWSFCAYTDRPVPSIPTWIYWTAAILFVGFAIIRNIPLAPFHYFAPTIVQ